MIVGCILDYYIIYVLLLKVTTKEKGSYIKKKSIYNNKKNIDKFDFVASLI